MTKILGIETSCDETAAAVFDTQQQKILSNVLFSQIANHKKYGGVVPEIASRSQLEKIDIIIKGSLETAGVTLQDIDAFAVTNMPGLVGSLLVGTCFTKAVAWALEKPIIGVNHLEGHIFSAFLNPDGSVRTNIPFPHISLTASGGHTSLYLVHDFGNYETIGKTHDDAAGEAFDKIGKVLGYGYPCGPIIEKLAGEVNFEDFFKYPRTKNKHGNIMFSFSGIKTAILYSLVKQNAYNMNTGPIKENITHALRQQVSSSLLVCVKDIFVKNATLAFKKYPDIKAFTFGGGVACNKFIKQHLQELCDQYDKQFYFAPPQFCTDNGGMIAYVGHNKKDFLNLILMC